MLTTCLLIIGFLELLGRFLSILRLWLTEILASSCVEESLIVILRVAIDYSTETSLSSTNWATKETLNWLLLTQRVKVQLYYTY